jgi:hypothetical protein
MWKQASRWQATRSVGGFLIWAYMALIARTLRWRIEGEEAVRALWESPQGMILAAWHSRILVMPTLQMRLRRRWRPSPHPLAMLVSLSPDGEYTRRACELMGMHVVRGSSVDRRKARGKGATGAVREMMALLGRGAPVCLTVDGPRGPREVAQIGAVRIAQQTRSPIMVFAASAAPARRLRTWDRLVVPRPFGRGVIVFDGPMEAPRDSDPELLRQELDRRLHAAHDRADRLSGLAAAAPSPAAGERAAGLAGEPGAP